MAVRLAVPKLSTLASRFLLIAMGIFGLNVGEALAEAEEIQAFPTQLCTWGWSQPLTEGTVPWSMQSRLAEAAAQGLEVVWWTDRLELFDQSQDLTIPLDRGQVDPTTLNIVRMPGDADAITSLVAQIQGGQPQARLQDGWLKMSLTSDLEAREFQSFSYRPRSILGKPQSCLFARPLTCRPQWQMEVEVELSPPAPYSERRSLPPPSPGDIAFEIGFELSAHGWEEPTFHRLTYRLLPSGSTEPGEVQVKGNAEVVIPLLLQPRLNRLTLDLAAAAERLPQGEDNVISDIVVTVRARRGATATLRWRRPRLISRQPQAQGLLAAFLEHSLESRQTYGLQQGMGGLYSRDRQPLLSAFFPPFKTAYALLAEGRWTPTAWVDGVHAVRGLVAYHLGTPLLSPPQAQGRNVPDGELLDQRTGVLRLATSLLQNRVYGADLLAFDARAPGDWEASAQLEIWDILLANGLEIGGIGVTPPTGAPLPAEAVALPEGGERPLSPSPASETRWISWLLAREKTVPELLAALRDRRIFFGDPKEWQGSLALRLTDAAGREYGRMGGKMVVPETHAFLHLDLGSWGRRQVRLIQGLMQPGRSVRYLRREAVRDPSQPVLLETQQDSFVRVEVWSGEALVVCSNPLWIRKTR